MGVDSLQKSNNSFRLSTSLDFYMSKNIDGSELYDEYYCPITSELMAFPVIDSEGNTYERSAIETWIKKNGTSPITRSKLSSTNQLFKNNAIHKLLLEEKNRPSEVMHSSIRRWINDESNDDDSRKETDAATVDTSEVFSPISPVMNEEWGVNQEQRRINAENARRRMECLSYTLLGIL